MFGKRSTRMRATIALGSAAMLALAGCGGGGGDDETPDAGATGNATNGGNGGDELIRVGFSQLGAESGWRTANTESVQASLTEENGIDMTFVDAQQRQENQIRALRDFVSQDMDVIAFSPVIETGWDQVLQEIKDAGIPVVLVDRTVDTTVEDPFETWIGSDFRAEGVKAGEWVAENFPDANVFELQGTLGSGAQVDRQEGFREIVGDQVIGEASGNFTRAEGRTAMEAALQAYPDLDLVFSHNDDMGLGAIEAIEAAGLVPGEDIRIVAVDAVKDGMQALLDGKFNFLVECNPVFGDQIVELIKAVHAGEEVPETTYVEETTFEQADIDQAFVDARPY